MPPPETIKQSNIFSDFSFKPPKYTKNRGFKKRPESKKNLVGKMLQAACIQPDKNKQKDCK